MANKFVQKYPQIVMHLQACDTYLEVFGTGTTNGETERKDDTRERQEHFKWVDPPGNQNDTENNEIETDIYEPVESNTIRIFIWSRNRGMEFTTYASNA